MAARLKEFLREPLLHFFVLGAVIFFFASGRSTEEPGRIVITRGQIEALTLGFSQTWQRQPTSEELEGLIHEQVREEVYYREALAMGLDKDDTVVRRRLRQKLEFITDDVAAIDEPTDVELADYLRRHPGDFRVEQQLTFSHVYLNPERHGQQLARDTDGVLTQLRLGGHNADVSSFGDPFLLEGRLEATPAGEIAKQFGDKFVTNLDSVPVGEWYGPVESTYGVHLVFVEERIAGRVPALAEVREAVHRDWSNARRLESNEKLFQSWLKHYTVTVEKPGPMDAAPRVARAE
ncbi:MAG TPA: peptidylprolyl isomerase [Povalibacter sp.]